MTGAWPLGAADWARTSATNASAIKRTSRPTHPVRMADSIPLYGRNLRSATEVSTAPGVALEGQPRNTRKTRKKDKSSKKQKTGRADALVQAFCLPLFLFSFVLL